MAGSDPDVTDEDVFENDFIFTGDGEGMLLSAIGFVGGEADEPAAISFGNGIVSFVPKLDGDFFLWVGGSPNVKGGFPLKDHVAAQNGREFHLCQ